MTALSNTVIDWLLKGDVSIQYLVYRDLLDNDRLSLRRRIEKEGWGAAFLARRHVNGDWGKGFYQPKWICSHYTLLDLKHLGIEPDNELIHASIIKILNEEKADDGGVNPARSIPFSDVCVNGMFLNYACYFGMEQEPLVSIVDFLLSEHMADGGFNCYSNRQGAVHSSLHSTLSVMEGILEYERGAYRYRLKELKKAWRLSLEFILQHHLYRSSTTGDTIDKKMLLLSWPSRWRFDILRALEHFRDADVKYDPRMQDAIDVLLKKQLSDGRWPLQGRHPGAVHFEMEKPGEPSRWNTLRALSVLRHFGIDGD